MKNLFKKISAAFLIGLVSLSFFAPLQASAAYTPLDVMQQEIAVSALDHSENLIIELLTWIQGLIAKLTEGTTHAIRWMIDFGGTMLEFPVVKAGFDVTLSLVNLLFVMSLIVIAFEIILDHNSHHAKELLGKIIIAGVLVNFSLLIAGFLLDFSNIFTNFFISNVDAAHLMGAFNTGKLGTAIFGPGLAQAIMAAMLNIIITALILITMTAVFIMATIRNIMVAGLLLIMPLTWGMWVFPKLGSHTSDWWEKFLKYGVLYLPTLTFFLWLAIVTSGNAQFRASTSALSATWYGGVLGTVIQIILVIGIIIFGLKAADGLGLVGSGIGLSLAKKAGAGAAKYGYRASGLRGLTKRTVGGAGAVAGALRNVPGLGRVLGRFTPIGEIANKAAGFAHQTHDMEEWQKANLANLNDHQLYDFVARNDIESAAKLAEISKRGVTNDFMEHGGNAQALAAMAQASGRIYHKTGDNITDIKEVGDILNKLPILAETMMGVNRATGQAYRTVAQQFERLSPGQAANLHHSNFADTPEGNEAILAISNNAAQLKAILSNGTPAAQAAVNAGLARLRASVPAGPLQNVDAQLDALDRQIDQMTKAGASKQMLRGTQQQPGPLAQRQALIQNTEINLRQIADPAVRARATGFINGQAVSRQIVARDTGNIINP